MAEVESGIDCEARTPTGALPTVLQGSRDPTVSASRKLRRHWRQNQSIALNRYQPTIC